MSQQIEIKLTLYPSGPGALSSSMMVITSFSSSSVIILFRISLSLLLTDLAHQIQELGVIWSRLIGEQVAKVIGGFSFHFLEVANYPVVDLNLEYTVMAFPSLSLFVEEAGVSIIVLQPFTS